MRARPSAPTTHCFLLPTLYSLLVPFVVHLHLRQRTAELPRSTEAHCIVTTHYFLPSPPYSLLKKYSCPFVSIRGSIICPFVVFVVSFLNVRTAIFAVLNGSPLHSDHALLSTLSSLLSFKKIFVSIRVHSWFYYLPFRGFRGFLPQCTHGNFCRAQRKPTA